VSFPAGAPAEGKGSYHQAQSHGSPSLAALAEDDIHLVMAGLVPAIPILKSAVLPTIEITGTRPVMT